MDNKSIILFILLMGNRVCCDETRTHGALDQQLEHTVRIPIIQVSQDHLHTQNITQTHGQQLLKALLAMKNTQPAKQQKPQPEIKKQQLYIFQAFSGLIQSQASKATKNTQIPQINSKVAQTLKKKNFFDKQLKSQKQKEIIKYGDDIYEGPLDEKKKPDGFGTIYKQDKSLFIGHISYGKAEGKGAFILPEGSYYYGQFYNNKAQCADGQYYSDKFHYRGGFSNNLFQGKGVEQGSNYKFEGEFHQGSRSKGKLEWKSQNRSYSYEGEFNSHNKFDGKGVLKQAEGTYEGYFVDGYKHGQGVYRFSNGKKYQGQYKKGVKQGKDGSVAYNGQFKNSLPHGKGRAQDADGNLIEGEWVNGIEKSLLK